MANSDAIRVEWRRTRLPGCRRAAENLVASAARGRDRASLLESKAPVAGATTGALRLEIATITMPTMTDCSIVAADESSQMVGWGQYEQVEAAGPGQGRSEKRPCISEDLVVLGGVADHLRRRDL